MAELADQYLLDESEKRAGSISAVKSFEAFRAWAIMEAGFYDVHQMPDGSLMRVPRSISFAAMDDLEFGQLYSAVLDVLWNYILFRTFASQEAAEMPPRSCWITHHEKNRPEKSCTQSRLYCAYPRCVQSQS